MSTQDSQPTSETGQRSSAEAKPAQRRAGLSAGDRFGKYEIGRQIGAGGMSVVWKGYDRLLDRHVAIKQLILETLELGDDLHERFSAEAAIQKKVSHSSGHIVRVFDLVDNEHGLFIVMEYVPGQSLDQKLAKSPEPTPPRDALGLVGTVAQALGAIHKHQIVHRDLKPSNILLTRSGGLKVCDFGLAALLGEQEALSTGSVRYMAPELFRAGPVDGRADIYSLGMIAYELLAGRKRFNDAFKIVLRDTRNQSLRWVKWHTNPRAKVAPLSKLGLGIDPQLDELVARMMEKDPDQRIASSAELIGAIRRHFAASDGNGAASGTTAGGLGDVGEETEALAGPLPDSDSPTAALPRRGRGPYILAAVLAAALVIVGGLWLRSNQRANAERAEARAEARSAYDQAKSEYQAKDYQKALAGFEDLAKARGANSTLVRASDAYAQLARAQLALQDGDYTAARDGFGAVQKLAVLKDLHREIEIQRDEANRLLSFATEFDKIEEAIEAGQWGAARQLHSDLADSQTATEAAQDRLSELHTRITRGLNQSDVDAALAKAAALVAEDRRDEAIRELELEQFKYNSPRIQQQIEQYERDTRYDRALAQADEAEQGGRLAEALAAVKSAAQIKPGAALQERARQLNGRLAFERGRAAEQAGDRAAAAAHYTSAAGYGLAAANQALERIKVANKNDAFIGAADQALASGDYETAIRQYENAQPLSAQVQSRLISARVRLKLRQGRDLLEQGEIEAAREAFNAAVELAPDDQAASQGLFDVGVRIKYLRLLAEGDELRATGRFRPAKRKYQAAKDALDTKEVQKRLSDTEYESLVAKAEYYISIADWKAADGWLTTASKVRSTKQVRQLMDKVKQQLKSAR